MLQVTTHHHKHRLLPLLMEELHLLLMRELMLEVEEVSTSHYNWGHEECNPFLEGAVTTKLKLFKSHQPL